jgi:5-methylcytosine-specific restriction endonuclease McrA
MLPNEKAALAAREYRKRNAANPEYKAKKSAWDKAYCEKHKAEISERNKAKYLENSEVVKEKVREYYTNNPDKAKAYREANSDKRKEQSRAWYNSNQDRVLAYRGQYAQENGELLRTRAKESAKLHPETGKAWKAANPEKVKASDKRTRENCKERIYAKNAKRRAVLKGAKVETVKREDIYLRDKGVCGLCGMFVEQGKMTLDHILPLSLGGEHSRQNIQLAHLSCNSSKGNRI